MNVIMHSTGAPDPDVFALGDAATIEHCTPPLPATAQVANQQAKFVTRTLNRLVRPALLRGIGTGTQGREAKGFRFQNAGSLAYVGDWNAVFDRTQAARGPKGKETGRVAWLLWRSAYFTKTLSVRNKILVPMYWCVVVSLHYHSLSVRRFAVGWIAFMLVGYLQGWWFGVVTGRIIPSFTVRSYARRSDNRGWFSSGSAPGLPVHPYF